MGDASSFFSRRVRHHGPPPSGPGRVGNPPASPCKSRSDSDNKEAAGPDGGAVTRRQGIRKDADFPDRSAAMPAAGRSLETPWGRVGGCRRLRDAGVTPAMGQRLPCGNNPPGPVGGRHSIFFDGWRELPALESDAVRRGGLPADFEKKYKQRGTNKGGAPLRSGSLRGSHPLWRPSWIRKP
jgi:hypothetical protein